MNEAAAMRPRKGTLEFALRRHAVAGEQLLERYPAVVPLVARILGVVPRAFSYLEIWPPAFESYALVVPAFFDIPLCDAGVGIGAGTRSLAAYAASRSHGCSYCAAHSAALGSVFRGARLSLEKNAAAISGGVCQAPSLEDKAVVDYAMAVARVPGNVTPKVREALARHFSPRQVEQIVLVTATMGLLNRCMDTLGMVLERPLLEMAREHLAATGWDERRAFDERFDGDLFRHESPLPELGPLQIARCMLAAVRFEARALAPVPSGTRRLEAHVKSALGFVPRYLGRLRNVRARRVLAHLLCERIVGSTGVLSPELRCAVCVKAADTSHNRVLKAHFTFMGAQRAGLEGFTAMLDGKVGDETTRVALQFASEASAVPPRVSPELVNRMSEVLKPETIIELVLTLSIFSTVQRIAITFDTEDLEPELQAFVEQQPAQQ